MERTRVSSKEQLFQTRLEQKVDEISEIVVTVFSKEFEKLSLIKQQVLWMIAQERPPSIDFLSYLLNYKYDKNDIWQAIEELFDLQVPIPKETGHHIGWQPLIGIIEPDGYCDLEVSIFIDKWLRDIGKEKFGNEF